MRSLIAATLIFISVIVASSAFAQPSPVLKLDNSTVTATGGTTARTLANRAADAINARDYGAIGDGASHPISGLTTFGGVNVTGWTLGQWQTAYPFITALTNEADEVAIVAAEKVALTDNKALYIPGGKYLTNFAASFSPTTAQTVTIIGDDGVTQIAVFGAITLFTFNMPTYTTTPTYATLYFRGLQFYQTDTSAIEGTAISILAPASGSTNQPYADFDHIQFGATVPALSTGSAFAVSVNLLNTAMSRFTNVNFEGNAWYSHPGGGANGRNGIGIKINGTSGSQLAFGPYLVDCVFSDQDIGVMVGDGTHAYVQGVKIIGGTTVATNTLVKWHSADKAESSDYLLVQGMDIQTYSVGIDVDTVATIHLVGDYFLGGNNETMVHIQDHGGVAPEWTLAGNTFESYGGATVGVQIDNTVASIQTSIDISSNKFFDFAGAGQMPIKLGTGITLASITSNNFSDDNASVDDGTNNSWTNNTVTTTSPNFTAHYATGIPILPANAYNAASAASGGPQFSANRVPVADQAKSVVVATEGGSYTVPNNISWVMFNAATALNAFTVTMPATPVDGQEVTFTTTFQIGGIIINPNTGQGVNTDAFGAFPLRTYNSLTFRWNKTNSNWQIRNYSQLPTGLAIPSSIYVYNSSATLISSGRVIIFNGTAAATLTLAAQTTLTSGDGFIIYNGGSAAVTIVPNGSDTIYNGSFILKPNESVNVALLGTNWFPIFGGEPKYGTPTVSACGAGSVSGKDNSMLLTLGSTAVTSCTVNFSNTAIWGSTAPHCTFAPANTNAAASSTTGAYLSAPTTTSYVLNGTALANTIYNVLCQ